jgi:arsenate reductase
VSLRVYAYAKCDTCRKALKFLAERKVAAEVIAIREQPPTMGELRTMLAHVGGELRRLFNTSGQDYQALKMKDRLPTMPTDQALALLAGDGNLVKRPFALGDGFGLVGFKPEEWERVFHPSNPKRATADKASGKRSARSR